MQSKIACRSTSSCTFASSAAKRSSLPTSMPSLANSMSACVPMLRQATRSKSIDDVHAARSRLDRFSMNAVFYRRDEQSVQVRTTEHHAGYQLHWHVDGSLQPSIRTVRGDLACTVDGHPIKPICVDSGTIRKATQITRIHKAATIGNRTCLDIVVVRIGCAQPAVRKIKRLRVRRPAGAVRKMNAGIQPSERAIRGEAKETALRRWLGKTRR